jgi:hypothetical protein
VAMGIPDKVRVKSGLSGLNLNLANTR